MIIRGYVGDNIIGIYIYHYNAIYHFVLFAMNIILFAIIFLIIFT